jgi:hypothetical protein
VDAVLASTTDVFLVAIGARCPAHTPDQRIQEGTAPYNSKTEDCRSQSAFHATLQFDRSGLSVLTNQKPNASDCGYPGVCQLAT